MLSENVGRSCRICLDNDNQDDLISPCLCTGGSAYVHRRCLDSWRAMNQSGRAFNMCDVCQFEYVIEPVIEDPLADKRRLLIFRLLVTRDISAILIIIQAIIVGLAFLLQYVDGNDHAIGDLFSTTTSSFGIYYLSSVILFFAFLGVFGLIGACCGCLQDNAGRTPTCSCYGCYCYPVSSNGCNGNHNCNGNGGSAAGMIIIVFAIIGVVVGIILSIIIIRKIGKRHTERLWLQQETKKYVVKDFQGRREELANRPARPLTAQNSVRNKLFDQQNPLKPSAPLAVITSNSS